MERERESTDAGLDAPLPADPFRREAQPEHSIQHQELVLNSRSSRDEESSPLEQNGAQPEHLPPLHQVESEDLLDGMREAERQETHAAYNDDDGNIQERKQQF